MRSLRFSCSVITLEKGGLLVFCGINIANISVTVLAIDLH
jgi:hypothetical protein